MKLKKNIYLADFLKTVNECRGDVFYESSDANIDLKSALSQFVFMTIANDAEAERLGNVRCTNRDDYRILDEYLV